MYCPFMSVNAQQTQLGWLGIVNCDENCALYDAPRLQCAIMTIINKEEREAAIERELEKIREEEARKLAEEAASQPIVEGDATEVTETTESCGDTENDMSNNE